MSRFATGPSGRPVGLRRSTPAPEFRQRRPAAWPWIALACLTPAVPARAGQIVVDPAGPVPTVTEALARARPGDRIVIKPGTYREPELAVKRRVEIVGEGNPVLDGGGGHQILTVTADGVVIRGLILANTGRSTVEDRAALKFIGVTGCQVDDVEVRNAMFGIYLAKSSGCRITHTRIEGQASTETLSGNAVHLWNCRDITIEDNVMTGHRDGIYLEFTENAHIARNTSTHNLRYGLHFMFSHGGEYRDNRFVENGTGVAVMYTHQVTMTGNRFERNWGSSAYGLLLKEISDSRLDGNWFADNSVGLYAEGTNRLIVNGNSFENNGWAVRLMADAQANRFERNTFLGNSFDVTTNGTSNNSIFEGNFWDHYAGYDLNHDGHGDVPYHPVRLFALLIQQNEPALILLRSFFVDLLDIAEHVLPVLTPETLVDERPLMRRPS